MPILLEKTKVSLEWGDLEKWRQQTCPPSAKRRSKGVHLSGVIRHVLKGLGKLKAEDESEEFPLRMALGMAWENWVVGLVTVEDEGFVWQPGEQELDGVYGTPDGMSTTEEEGEGGLLVEEFKLTWKSEFKYGDVVKEALWMWQLAGLCKMMGTRMARLHIAWVCGDYRPPEPKYYRYRIEFTERELEEFWENIVRKYKGEVEGEAGT